MAEQESGRYLEVEIYPYPNPALTEILVGEPLAKVVGDYTAKVAAVFIANIQDRKRIGDRHPGLMSQNTYAQVHVGGFKDDRVVGEVGSTVPYMSADEFGRHSGAPYPPHHSLQNALYSVLPYAP